MQGILRPPQHKGTYPWGDVSVKSAMPAIVDEKEWEAAQMVVSRKQRKEEV